MRRSRFVLGVLAALCSLAAVLPAGAQARTHHVSIIAVPNPIDAGDPVVLVGLNGWDNITFRLGRELSVRLPSGQDYAAQVGPVLDQDLPHGERFGPINHLRLIGAASTGPLGNRGALGRRRSSIARRSEQPWKS